MKSISFVAVALLSLLPVPILNGLLLRDLPSHPFSLEMVRGATSKSLAAIGISSNPKQVFVGEGGTLFLGGQYANTVFNSSTPATEADLDNFDLKAKNLQRFAESIESEFDVEFYLVVGPNKSSVVKEDLPAIFYIQEQSKTSASTQALSKLDFVVNPSEKLINSTLYSYYKTDTHWNQFGGYQAYEELVDKLSSSRQLSGLEAVKLNDEDFNLEGRTGGDLSRFLMTQDLDADFELRSDKASIGSLSQIDSAGNVIREWDHVPVTHAGAGAEPTYYVNPEALNKSRVLWVRDSFGASMSPYIHSTFENVLSVHANDADLETTKILIGDFRPDIVLFTLVERTLVLPHLFFFQ